MGIRRDDISAYQRTQIALAILSPQRCYGEVTHLANRYHLSRKSIYAIANKAYEVLLKLLEPEAHGPQAKETAIKVGRNRVVRAVGRLTLAGVSQRNVVDCVAEMLDTSVSLGWVNGRIAELEKAAASWNQHQHPDIGESLSGDELYANGQPNLMVIGNESLYIYALSRQASCDGETWASILRCLPNCPQFASDAGCGLAAGAKVAGLRVHQLDWDHLLRPLWGQHARLERQAYAALEAVEQRTLLFEAADTEKRLQKHLDQWHKLNQEAEEKMERLHSFTQLARQVDNGFALIDPQTGQLPDSGVSIAQLQEVGRQLASWSGRIYRKLASNLMHWAEKLFTYQAVLRPALWQLFTQYGQQAVQALCALWQIEAHEKRHPQSLSQRMEWRYLWEKQLDTAIHWLGDKLIWEVWDAVRELLGHSWRGSMLVECVNSLLRPRLDKRQHTDQGCLDLFHFSHNQYPFKRGKRKGYSPAQLAGLDAVDDPLTLLGLTPKVLL